MTTAGKACHPTVASRIYSSAGKREGQEEATLQQGTGTQTRRRQRGHGRDHRQETDPALSLNNPVEAMCSRAKRKGHNARLRLPGVTMRLATEDTGHVMDINRLGQLVPPTGKAGQTMPPAMQAGKLLHLIPMV